MAQKHQKSKTLLQCGCQKCISKFLEENKDKIEEAREKWRKRTQHLIDEVERSTRLTAKDYNKRVGTSY